MKSAAFWVNNLYFSKWGMIIVFKSLSPATKYFTTFFVYLKSQYHKNNFAIVIINIHRENEGL
jgi:hypothetical protein